jgi:hypothetical protein
VGKREDTGAQTGFKWGFAKKLKGDDRKRLETLKGYVGASKNADVLKGNGEALELESVVARPGGGGGGGGGGGAGVRRLGPSMPPPGELEHAQRQASAQTFRPPASLLKPFSVWPVCRLC